MITTKPSDNWQTPDWLKERIVEFFNCHFYDPCPINAKIDALTHAWPKPFYCNPPYSKPLPWCEKVVDELRDGGEGLLLLNHDHSVRWFARLMEADPVMCLFAPHNPNTVNKDGSQSDSGRIKFLLPDGTIPSGGKKPNTLFYIGDREERFKQAFEEFGYIVGVV